MHQHIFSTVKSCFKHTKLTPAALSSLAQSLYFVALGIRATQLIDYYIPPTQAKQLVKKLRQHVGCTEMILLQFSDRYTFIGHRQRLLEHYQAYSVDGGLYVDVQGKTPVKLTQAPVDFDRFITQQLGPYLTREIKSEDDTRMVVSTLPCFMVALTGWLLEYPVVYVCHQVDEVLDEWEPRTNCLGNLNLEWIKLQILMVEPGQQQKQQQHYPLLSFTCPSHLLSEATQQDRLVSQVRMKFSSRLSTSMSLVLAQETVCLDRVAL
ncbi:hypothetical protein BC941DRAFT_443225 [Chlamydoabsidia padenii]|nr:hypothetical protein BC941DRAFT_443225 [Chlamydoabsidia padenii]